MYAIVECTQRLGNTSSRLRLFGCMIGVIDADEYTPRLAAVFCHLLRVVFPRLSANTLRTSKEGRDSVLLASAIAAANAVFPDTQPALSYDRVRLTGGRRESLLAEIRGFAEPYRTALAKSAAISTSMLSTSLAAEETDVSSDAGFLQPLKRVGGPESPDKVLSASERREKFDMDDMVISFDTLVDLVISHWRQQLEVDLTSAKKLFINYLEAKGDVDFSAFCALLQYMAPGKAFAKGVLVQLFEQLSELDDDTSNDDITADMFVAFCRQNGFVPPPLSSDSFFEPSTLRIAGK